MKVKALAVSIMMAAGVLLVSACNDKTAKSEPAAAQPQSVGITQDSTFEQKVAYALGASVGSYMKAVQSEQKGFMNTELDQELILKGFEESLRGGKSMSDEEISKTLMDFEAKMREAVEAKAEAEAQDNLDAGKKFLEDNAKKDSVKVTASGLQYKVIKEGTGKQPTAADTVRVKYKGTLIDGTVFDEQMDEPVSFPLGNIIPGWVEGMQLMKEGGVYELYIPSELAYGKTGAGQIIAPNSTLIFNVELVEVIRADAGQADQEEAEAEK